MQPFYTKNVTFKLLSLFVLLIAFLALSPGKLAAQVKDSTITSIYTDFKTYWKTSTTGNNAVLPDTSHNLLGFTFRGKTYSTGVNDATMDSKLGSANYVKGSYKALPVSNIAGNVVAGNSTYIATAIKNDGDSTKAAYTSPYPTIRIADVLTDGKNGLDLGTGVTNLPKGGRISFSIKNLSTKAATDTIPDLVLTQIATPTASVADTIFFYDASGKIVGNKKLVTWTNVSKLGTYKLDLYSLTTGVSCNTATINGFSEQNGTRDIRMVGFLLTEFGITNTDSAAKVKGIMVQPNGTSDQAFIAYNTAIINLDVPVITSQPATQTFCSAAATSSVTFSVSTTSTTTTSYQWKKNGAAIAGATSSAYTATGLKTADTANAYTVTVTNSVGSITSDPAYVKYVIVTQPTDIYTPNGSTATFTVGTSGATGYQWMDDGILMDMPIAGATSSSYTIPSVSILTPNTYYVSVSYAGGTCNSNSAQLYLESLPSINTQPQNQILCSNSITSATFTVAASGPSAISYQWYKNGSVISGATASSYTATGLTLADTTGVYKVTITSRVGSVTSNSVGLKYLVLSQPASQYVATGAGVTFSVTTSSIATGLQWQKNGAAISGATAASYTIPAVALADSGSYTAVVSYSGGTCTSNAALLKVENVPVIAIQPQSQALCNTTTTALTFSVAATSTSALSYQWKKNGIAIDGATSSSYTATGLTLADTANIYRVVVTNGVGSVTSSGAGFRYIILAQPLPASAYLATGNSITFTAAASSYATAFQWRKNGTAVSGATSLSFSKSAVNTSDAGNYTLDISYPGGTCTSNAAVLTTSTILYSKAGGNISNVATWGVATDGSGSSPVDFTRTEHTFVVANRDTANTTASLKIAGTLDVANATTTITQGTTLDAGRIIRSLSTGKLAGSATAALTVHGASHLYFDAATNTLQTLTINTTDTVHLHTKLNITAGYQHGIVIVSAGKFVTGDSLTLKSDAFGTAAIGNSAGIIIGKVTVERFIPAHRAWRLFSAPVAKSDAPTINTAWQEGATTSTDNPHPGYGTHITYGAESDGFDQNPQKSFSMYMLNGSTWTGIPATNKTLVTDYRAYMFFIRGDRSYDIKATTSSITPLTTVIRTTGSINQGQQPAIPVNASGFTLIGNPFASPVNFERIYQHSNHLAHHMRIWNPELGGSKGVGAYVVVYWDGTDYSVVPNVGNGSVLKNIQANQGFFVESTGIADSIYITESDKDTTNTTIPFGRAMAAKKYASKLEVNLKVFNEDSTTNIADGVAYLFDNSFNSNIDGNDIKKIPNTNENLGVVKDSSLLTVEQRSMPVDNDSLHLSFTGAKTSGYQLEFIPTGLSTVSLYLYDRYLNTLLPIDRTDTSRFTIRINTSIAASKVGNRFTIVTKGSMVLPVTFTSINAYKKGESVQVDWSTANEVNVRYYDVEKSCDGNYFKSTGQVVATGKTTYGFTDEQPCNNTSYYRIKSVSNSGEAAYTTIAPVIIGEGKSVIAVHPNPLTASHFLLEIHNYPAGKYQLTLTSNTGQTVYNSSITYDGKATLLPVSLPAVLAKGVYQLQIASNSKKETIKLLCNY